MDQSDNQTGPGRKIRHKKTSWQRTTKRATNGSLNNGTRIEDESYQYFVNIWKTANQTFDDDDDKKYFVDNVFAQLEGNELKYCSNQLVSRIVETLLPLANDDRVENLMRKFENNLRVICTCPYASHVLETLISVGSSRYGDSESVDATYDDHVASESTSLKTFFGDWVFKVATFVQNNLSEFVYDTYANHVVRTTLACLAGFTDAKNFNLSSNDKKNVEERYVNLLKNVTDQFSQWPDFSELATTDITSGLLQILLQVVSAVDKARLKTLIRKLLDESFTLEANNWVNAIQAFNKKRIQDVKLELISDEDEEAHSAIKSILANSPCLRAMEVAISVASKKTFTQIYAKCFINNLQVYAAHPKINHAVQKLLMYCSEPTEFESMADELMGDLEGILDSGNTGVILQLCEGCMRFKSKQSTFLQSWMKALHCDSSSGLPLLIAPLTVYMMKAEQLSDTKIDSKPVNLHGSLILQGMLKFNKPIKIVNSILQMDAEKLCKLLSNPRGCYITDAYVGSEYVGEKSRERLVKLLEGNYSVLGSSKHGSRTFDCIWKIANLKQKSAIAAELLENEFRLNSSFFGKLTIQRVSLATFRHKKEDWMKALNKCDNVKKLFSDIVS